MLGVRNWYGDAFVSLQEEPLKVIDGFFSQFGAFVLSGCEVKANGSKYDIAPGLVVLEGPGADNATVKVVVPFAGITATALPVYLTLGCETETDVYNDGNVKPIAHIYKAVATTVNLRATMCRSPGTAARGSSTRFRLLRTGLSLITSVINGTARQIKPMSQAYLSMTISLTALRNSPRWPIIPTPIMS